ncbi:cadherin-like protein 26 [Sparus aurata]|uniref:cadherin-like protein 26 n=1 Tax=Sparus aurata TaxID=8175 RepID=UPI0011C0FB10|nr:B-cadherin-like [Sparus aurata]
MEVIHFSLFVILCLGANRSSSEILQRQRRNWIIESFTIDEGYKGPFPYSLGRIKIERDLKLFRIEGQGVDKEPKDVLAINERTGEITVKRPVDYEQFKVLKLIFQAYREEHLIDTQLGIEIRILDVNDNPPKFEPDFYNVIVQESTIQGSTLATVKATDSDTSKRDGKFDLKIVSVSPEPHDLEFTLEHLQDTDIGTISFKGCLDHERAEKYTIIVEAKDQGEDEQLSSSCTVIINIEDGNNHVPVIKGQTGPGRVKEGEENVLVSRLQVSDEDTMGSPAWIAKFKIDGDTRNNFRITTNPETNEGLLYVEKSLDYEDGPLKNVTIIVENEIPYHLCKVESRSSTGLWQVVTTGEAGTVAGVFSAGVAGGGVVGGMTGTGISALSVQLVTVAVDDINEAPIFDKSHKKVTLGENVGAGRYLETFTARDPDVASANTFTYKIGYDPEGWVQLDPATGKITTKKSLDRESKYVKNNIYNVTILAIDDGNPQMTGTATLDIHVTDENDNTPTLNISIIDMCQLDGPFRTNISAFDLDEEPYGGPFRFKLLGNDESMWRLEPRDRQVYSVSLVKEKTVHSGKYQLMLEVSDLQNKAAVHNITLTVCECSNPAMPNCRNRKPSVSAMGGGAFGIIFLSLLLLAGVLLLAFLLSCKPEKVKFPEEIDGSGQHLTNGNIEIPGTDVIFMKLDQPMTQVPALIPNGTGNMAAGAAHSNDKISEMELWQNQTSQDQWGVGGQQFIRGNFWRSSTGTSSTMRTTDQSRNSFMRKQNQTSQDQWGVGGQQFIRGNFWRSSTGTSSTMRTTDQSRNSFMRKMKAIKYSTEYEIGVHREFLSQALNMKLFNLQTLEEELGDYAPHVYAEEEDTETRTELDAISMTNFSFDLDWDQDLDFKFSTLASICMPREISTYSTKTSYATENLETATLLQMESQKTTMNRLSHIYHSRDSGYLSGDSHLVMRSFSNA